MSTRLTSPEARYAPAHTAVVVVDMQHDFLAEDGYVQTVVGKDTSPCRAIIPALDAFLTQARAANVPVIWVRAMYAEATLAAPIRVKQLEKGPEQVCVEGTQGAAWYGVEPQSGEAVFTKTTYSAFTDPALAAHLSAAGIRSLIFTGVQTNVCVETSLREAVCRGFYAAIAEDCTASHAPALHEATLTNVRFLFGDVLPANAFTKMWTA